jgi:ABC-type transport system involved in cytochrome bd biosynthesis fused ATPase/permease subunit
MTVLAVSHRAVAFDRADQVIRLDAGHHIAGHHDAGHHMARSTPPESQGGGIT